MIYLLCKELFKPQNVEIVMFYFLLISLLLFFPFFSYHAHSSCFPNAYPNPQTFPRSFFGSHLALILSLTDKTYVWIVVMAELLTIRFPVGVIVLLFYPQTRWSFYNEVFSSLWISLWPPCLYPHSLVTCWQMTRSVCKFSVSEAHGMISDLGTQRGSMSFSVRQKLSLLQTQTH